MGLNKKSSSEFIILLSNNVKGSRSNLIKLWAGKRLRTDENKLYVGRLMLDFHISRAYCLAPSRYEETRMK